MSAHFNEVDQKLLTALKRVSLAMFRKNFFGIFHGSISARLNHKKFVINKKRAVFDDLNPQSLIALETEKDYRWNESSLDTAIHAQIYLNHPDAKFIAYAMPPYSLSYSLKYSLLCPLDFFGRQILGEKLDVLDPRDYGSWYERAGTEISEYFRKNNRSLILIKGYGIYAFDRDLHSLAKMIALVENSCKILHYNADLQSLL